MSSGIYLIQNNNQLVRMNEAPYESEDLLQTLLTDYPDLLAGDQIDSSNPRRWLLVSREMSVPSEENGANRWSVDHLFLDQEAIPTLIEVKRSSDTRIRREVVGQMLDYAANGVVYWPVEILRTRFEANCQAQGLDPTQTLAEFLGTDAELDQFWQDVEANLNLGKVRMIFVADKIPTELQRIVEFLNVQMSPAEVLAVEIKQYLGQGLKTLVPRVIGQTVEAQQKKSSVIREIKQWDDSSFFAELEIKRGIDETQVARKIFAWACKATGQVQWGSGKQYGSMIPKFSYSSKGSSVFAVGSDGIAQLGYKGKGRSLFTVWTDGTIHVYSPFRAEEKWTELQRRLQSLAIKADSKYMSLPLFKLLDSSALEQFLQAFNWVIEQMKLQ